MDNLSVFLHDTGVIGWMLAVFGWAMFFVAAHCERVGTRQFYELDDVWQRRYDALKEHRDELE